MRDQYGRDICYLRISVTDRCNLRCVYCMPEEGVAWMPHSQILTYEQITQVVEAASRLGVRHIRLTGGEPLVRPQLYRLVEMVKGVAGIESVALTTNGVLLAQQFSQLRQAGLDGVNLSLDTLDPQQFAAITRREGLLPQVLEGLEAAAGTPGLTVKVNCVPTQFNEDHRTGAGPPRIIPRAGDGAADRCLWHSRALCQPQGSGTWGVRHLLRVCRESGIYQCSEPPVLPPV